MPELDVKYSGAVSPKRRRSSSRSPDRGLKNHRHEHEDDHNQDTTTKRGAETASESVILAVAPGQGKEIGRSERP